MLSKLSLLDLRTLAFTCALALTTLTSTARADDWIGGAGQTISALEPLLSAEGGAVRIVLPNPINVPYCGNGSSQSAVFDLLFINGTQETRSATIAGLYVAFAAGKTITLLLSSAACSPYAAPEVVGININQ